MQFIDRNKLHVNKYMWHVDIKKLHANLKNVLHGYSDADLNIAFRYKNDAG